MKLQLIRNATLLLEFGGHHILIDPYFAPKHSRPTYTGKSENPMTDLPLPVEDIIRDIDLLMVTHLHSDHFDSTAQDALPKNIPLVCKPDDMKALREKGFTELRPVEKRILWHNLTITRVGGHHGLGEVENLMGSVCGFVLHAPDEPKIYLCGDTVLCHEVREAVVTHQPDVIVTHSSGATWKVNDKDVMIVMDAAQTVELCQLAMQSAVIAVHMDALDHGRVTRQDIRIMARNTGVDDRLMVPEDGEMITF